MKFYIMFQGKVGVIEASNYEKALSRFEEVIRIEVEHDNRF